MPDDLPPTVTSALFSTGRIGPVEVRNRIVLPSMTPRAADEEGLVPEDAIAYYVARARGGVGLVTVEMAAPEPVGRHRRRELGIYDRTGSIAVGKQADLVLLDDSLQVTSTWVQGRQVFAGK